MAARVLVVDDERDFARLLAERLELRGFVTGLAHDGNEALARLAGEEFDVVVLDVFMPGPSGIETLEEIKKASPSLQAILLTGQASVATAIEGMKQGAFDFLVKPVDVDKLAEVIGQALVAKAGEEESLRMIETGKMAALGELAQGVAHEINNPVNIMVQEAGWIEDLLDEDGLRCSPQADELRQATRRIMAQGSRCKEITLKLLSLGGRIDHRPRPVNLGELLGQALADWRPRLDEAGLAACLDVEPGLPLMRVSPSEMREVVNALVNNALDAARATSRADGASLGEPGRRECWPGEALTGEAGSGECGHAQGVTSPGGPGGIGVRLARAGDSLQLTVTDTGPGIAPEVLPRIFEPFFSTKDVGQGTGLGLAICFAIVTRLGGTIDVRPGLGQGASFSVSLPLTLAVPDQGQPASPATSKDDH